MVSWKFYVSYEKTSLTVVSYIVHLVCSTSSVDFAEWDWNKNGFCGNQTLPNNTMHVGEHIGFNIFMYDSKFYYRLCTSKTAVSWLRLSARPNIQLQEWLGESWSKAISFSDWQPQSVRQHYFHKGISWFKNSISIKCNDFKMWITKYFRKILESRVLISFNIIYNQNKETKNYMSCKQFQANQN